MPISTIRTIIFSAVKVGVRVTNEDDNLGVETSSNIVVYKSKVIDIGLKTVVQTTDIPKTNF